MSARIIRLSWDLMSALVLEYKQGYFNFCGIF